MTRKDYELLAQVVRDLKMSHYSSVNHTDEHVTSATYVLGDLERALAHALSAANPRFDVNRFLNACSLSHNV